jgi:hypothetical protein
MADFALWVSLLYGGAESVIEGTARTCGIAVAYGLAIRTTHERTSYMDGIGDSTTSQIGVSLDTWEFMHGEHYDEQDPVSHMIYS